MGMIRRMFWLRALCIIHDDVWVSGESFMYLFQCFIYQSPSNRYQTACNLGHMLSSRPEWGVGSVPGRMDIRCEVVCRWLFCLGMVGVV